jgi:hypothetical protein
VPNEYVQERAKPVPRRTPQTLDPSKAFQGLTVKMEAYCQARVAGANMVEAYGQAYSTENSSRETMYRASKELEANPRITARINQLVDMRDQATLLGSNNLYKQLSKQYVINGVMQLSQTASTDAVKLRAFEMLGKTVGIDLFRDVVVTEKRERSSEEVDKELRERIAQLRQAAIDVTPNSEQSRPTIDVTPNNPPLDPADRRRRPRQG